MPGGRVLAGANSPRHGLNCGGPFLVLVVIPLELDRTFAEAAKERANRVVAEQAAAVAIARLDGEERARQRIEGELQAVSAREQGANVQIKDLTAQLVDDRLVRARNERELRKSVDLRRGGAE